MAWPCIAAQSLIALGHLAAEPRYVDAAERAVKIFAPGLAESPGSQATLLVALDRLLEPPSTIVLAGNQETTRAWRRSLERDYRPDFAVIDAAGADPPGALRKGEPPREGAAAWICRGMHCLPPVTAYDALQVALDAS